MPDFKPTEDVTEASRRQFLAYATGMLIMVCSAAIGVPLIGSFIGPVRRIPASHWLKVANLSELPSGDPVGLKVTDVQEDAYLRQSVVRHLWAIKHSDASVSVFSPTCPHLGCQFNWNAASRRFECPCHGSIYSPEGKVLGGPAPRPLDTMETRIEQGSLLVNWQQFRSGIAQKIPV